ncbi:unnamed protein product [Somion occarium]|uniref:Geranylgeranyl pyrophosphate synthetase n=1 Tax=Somion occarium TaxID=3059160 RepID=A0ABP1E159_9APHY
MNDRPGTQEPPGSLYAFSDITHRLCRVSCIRICKIRFWVAAAKGDLAFCAVLSLELRETQYLYDIQVSGSWACIQGFRSSDATLFIYISRIPSDYRRGRGSGNSRGRGRGIVTVSDPSIEQPVPRDIDEGLLPGVLRTLSRPRDVFNREVSITNLEYLGSYNWVDEAHPTIIVPGSPPIWKHRPLPYQVQADRGIAFIDQNGYRLPSSCLLPLFKAVDVVAEDNADVDIDWPSVDFVTDRNGLRKLMRWLDDTGDGDRPREFRIDLQLGGKGTVLMSRWQEKTWEPAGFSFGFSFEKASTKAAARCERSTGHHRIVQYDFDGLKMVVRFEVDACIETLAPHPSSRTGDVDDLASQLSGLSVSSTSSRAAANTSSTSDVDILRGGRQVPQSSIIELTTRSERNAATFDWKEQYPQLYLSQTIHHFLAIHQRGYFTRIEKRKLSDNQMNDIHARAEESFKKLRALLGTIQDLVIGHGQRGRLSLLCQNGELQVRERESQDSFLPDEVMKRFDF